MYPEKLMLKDLYKERLKRIESTNGFIWCFRSIKLLDKLIWKLLSNSNSSDNNFRGFFPSLNRFIVSITYLDLF